MCLGIGKSVSIKLHQLGVEVYAISKTKANLESLEKECPGIKTIQQDLADWKGTKEKIEALPVFELLVNNAGLGNQNLFIDVPEDEMDKLVSKKHLATSNSFVQLGVFGLCNEND